MLQNLQKNGRGLLFLVHPVNEIVNKAHQRANHIIRCFVSGHTSTLIRAFIVHVRPILEYNCVVWSPSLKKDIDLSEKVQRRFTKRLRGLKDLPYREGLQRVDLPSLELRRLHLDLTFCYNIVFGQICVNFDDFFTISPSSQTRGHPYKLYKPRCTNSTRRNFLLHGSLMPGTTYCLQSVFLLCQLLRNR